MASSGFKIVARAHANVDQQQAFDIVLPIDLPQVFTGYGPLPAVKSVEHFDGAWDAAGQSRQINLSDGSHGIESMKTFESPSHFGYTIKPFTGMVGNLVDRAEGEWRFTPIGEGTDIQWTYTWFPKPIGTPVVWMLSKLWKPYMERIVKRCALVTEQEAQ